MQIAFVGILAQTDNGRCGGNAFGGKIGMVQIGRFCAFPNDGQMPEEPLDLTLGSLADIADMVTL